MPKKTFLRLPEEKKKRILDAAADEFTVYKENYEKSKVQRIAEKAGIAVGSFYKYFFDKADLLFCAFDANRKKPEIRTDSSSLYEYSMKEMDFNVQLNETGEVLADIIFANPQLFHDLVFRDEASMDYLQRIRDYLEKDREKGLLRKDLDVDLAAYFYTTIEYIAYQYCLRHDIDFKQDDRIAQLMMDILFFGIYRDGAVDELQPRVKK